MITALWGVPTKYHKLKETEKQKVTIGYTTKNGLIVQH